MKCGTNFVISAKSVGIFFYWTEREVKKWERGLAMKPAWWRSESLFERARQTGLPNIAARLPKYLHNFSTFHFSPFSLCLMCFSLLFQVNTVAMVAKRLCILFTKQTSVCFCLLEMVDRPFLLARIWEAPNKK